MRVILDTNVWLDWLVFYDPGVIALRQARDSKALEIAIDAPCRDELIRVLAYPQFGLDARSRAHALAQVDRLSTLLEELDYPFEDSLPCCSDPDDVKFLALAAASDADWLITKDNALLPKRRRRNAFSVSYRVATPQQWALYQSDDLLLSDQRSSSRFSAKR